MSLYNYEKPWLLTLRGISFIVLGLFSFLQIRYTFPVLLLTFAILLIFNVFMRVAEVYWMKVEKNRVPNLVLAAISLLFIVWFVTAFDNFDLSFDKIDASRLSGFIVIVAWLVFTSLSSLYEAVGLLIKKASVAYVFVIDFVLSGLMAYFLYIVVTQAENPLKALETFGIYSFCVGLVSLALTKLLIASTREVE